ncbi:unnamed protein product, partial [Owenia fusiformis]
MYRQQFPNDPGMHNTMNQDSYTRVSYRRNPNFFERVGNSCVGIVVGFLLITGAVFLLFWNEGRAVQTSKSLDEGLDNVVQLKTVDVAFEHNNGKLVYLSGSLKTSEILRDDTYGVAVHAVKLKRNVEMYQWVEHEHKREINEGSNTRTETTYSYSQEWRSDVVNSGSFSSPYNHQNPNSMPVQTSMKQANEVQVGNFYLSTNLLSKLSGFKKLMPREAPKDPSIFLLDGTFYHGSGQLTNPQVGDLRVTFHYAGLSGAESASLGPPDVVSVIARQSGNSLSKYETEAGDDLEMLYMGQLTAEQIFQKEHMHNKVVTWGVRGGGWLLMFIGFGCFTSLITTLVDWIPIVRELVAKGVTTMNLFLSISLSLTVIALGWIRYRPLLGMTILALAATPFIWT